MNRKQIYRQAMIELHRKRPRYYSVQYPAVIIHRPTGQPVVGFRYCKMNFVWRRHAKMEKKSA